MYEVFSAGNWRKLRNEEEDVVRLQMASAQLRYGTTIHYCLLQIKSNRGKEFQVIQV
jgi:hypothetical protein